MVSNFIIGAFVGFFSGYIWGHATTKIGVRKYGTIKGYHIHHTFLGLIAFSLSPFTLSDITRFFQIIGFGVGMIIEHTFIDDGFVLITKN